MYAVKCSACKRANRTLNSNCSRLLAHLVNLAPLLEQGFALLFWDKKKKNCSRSDDKGNRIQ